MARTTYEVIVGNVGRVYEGTSKREADKVYHDYIEISQKGLGRAGGEEVTLFVDGEFADSYVPMQDWYKYEGRPAHDREDNPTARQKPQTGVCSSPYDWGEPFTIQSSGRPKTAILFADVPDGAFRRALFLRASEERADSGLLPVVYPLGDGQYAFPPTLTYFADGSVRRGNRNFDTLATRGWDAFCEVDGNYYVLAFVGENEVPRFGVANPDDKKSMPKAIVGKLTNFTLMPPPKRTSNPSGRVSNPSKSDLLDSVGKMTRSYLNTAIWAESDPNTGEPLSDKYDKESFNMASIKQAKADCDAFMQAVIAAGLGDTKVTKKGVTRTVATSPAAVGHDFWLTRCHHGAGFWDGDYEAGEELTNIAHRFAERGIFPSGKTLNIEHG